ncbi:hypothetical protein O1Q96_24555 [Streptomyces sp. Qhu-G9]|uniref:hypothetical protein n=1 Tax=Streptomyces sp. Qhu-G9 TaxID=3452799 RepID=UPI0022AC3DC5|nr:hypothetical protein [Streptomyces aurantiacus]WAU82625.1 hypothetical protein O1Q96_24555 [Streptomyces aurantiacus]
MVLSKEGQAKTLVEPSLTVGASVGAGPVRGTGPGLGGVGAGAPRADRGREQPAPQGNRNPFIDHPEWVEAIW